MTSRTHPFRLMLTVLAALTILAAACGGDDEGNSAGSTTSPGGGTSTTSPSGGLGTVVFNGQGNNLVAYETEPPFTSQVVIQTVETDPKHGRDINAQICFFDHEGETWFVAGEDTHQPDPPAGWGIFRLDGRKVGDFKATQIGKLTPTYQPATDQPENYGCGRLSDGRLLTVDVGNQAGGAATGQLIVWFPPFDDYDVAYCKLDIGIGTGQSILVDSKDNIYVSSARSGGEGHESGVWRYTGPFPTSADAEGGCGKTDDTGAPLADQVNKTMFIPTDAENGTLYPAGLAWTPSGGMYVSSVANGVINEYEADGSYVRTILKPPAGSQLGPMPYPTGTPLGIGVGPDGTLYYADIGVIRDGTNIGPGDDVGTVRCIMFDTDGTPEPPETMDEGLPFPDGIGIYVP